VGLLAVSTSLGPIADVRFIVARLDLILAGVSLIPAFPLDADGSCVRPAGPGAATRGGH